MKSDKEIRERAEHFAREKIIFVVPDMYSQNNQDNYILTPLEMESQLQFIYVEAIKDAALRRLIS